MHQIEEESEILTSLPQDTSINSLKIDYITRQTQKKMNALEKCDLIVDHVRNGGILVFEGGLDPSTELQLIQKSMESIDHEKFIGLEIISPRKLGSSMFQRERRVTVITPANCDVHVRTF